jgi:hypothetical protein
MAKNFASYRRLNAPHAAGTRAIRVFVCDNPKCEIHHEQAPPVQCVCGGISFARFDSKTEAGHWAQLRMLEKRGKISDLQRQIWFPLYAAGPAGPIKITSYVADFTWIEDGERRIGDSKPRAGVDDLAALKLKWMEAQGNPVTILTKGIYR